MDIAINLTLISPWTKTLTCLGGHGHGHRHRHSYAKIQPLTNKRYTQHGFSGIEWIFALSLHQISWVAVNLFTITQDEHITIATALAFSKWETKVLKCYKKDYKIFTQFFFHHDSTDTPRNDLELCQGFMVLFLNNSLLRSLYWEVINPESIHQRL